jgi:hypothetical protein
MSAPRGRDARQRGWGPRGAREPVAPAAYVGEGHHLAGELFQVGGGAHEEEGIIRVVARHELAHGEHLAVAVEQRVAVAREK